jgi:hypothetical protein
LNGMREIITAVKVTTRNMIPPVIGVL